MVIFVEVVVSVKISKPLSAVVYRGCSAIDLHHTFDAGIAIGTCSSRL